MLKLSDGSHLNQCGCDIKEKERIEKQFGMIAIDSGSLIAVSNDPFRCKARCFAIAFLMPLLHSYP